MFNRTITGILYVYSKYCLVSHSRSFTHSSFCASLLCVIPHALGKYLTLQPRLSWKNITRAQTYSSIHKNTYFSNKRSCFCRGLPLHSFFWARANRNRRFSGRIANRPRSLRTWDYRDSWLPMRGDKPCRGRCRVSGSPGTRDRALSARSPIYPVQTKDKDNKVRWEMRKLA